jgi:hypothetical protein
LLTQEQLEEIVQRALDQFYKRRLASFEKLSIKKLFKRKNPYLFRAVGINDPRKLVDAVLAAHFSSSDEGIFGNKFFETIAQEISGGRKSKTDSIDVELERGDVAVAYAVKSGNAVFNNNSLRKQIEAFEECRRRLTGYAFEAVVGYGYGRRESVPGKGKKNFREVSGQGFWEEMSGDPDLYKKLLPIIGKKADEHAPQYERAVMERKEKMIAEFLAEFGAPDGQIDWDKLLAFNSGKKQPKGPKVKNEKKSPQVQLKG